MGIIGKAVKGVGGVIVRAFRTVEHSTNATVYWIRDGARDTTTELRTFGRDFFTSLKRIDKKKAPWILYFIGFMSLVVATMYLMRLFDHFPTLREEMSFGRQLFTIVVGGFLFGQYVFHVMAVFKLSSGMKIAWASMMRTSISYIFLMIVTESNISSYLPIRVVTYESWILVAVMLLVILLMFLGKVREFYTPAYLDEIPISHWLQYIAYRGPLKKAVPASINAPEMTKIGHDIDRRNKTDMRVYPTMIFAILAIYTAIAFYRLFFMEGVTRDNMISVVMAGAGLVFAIMYVLVTRAYRHNKRDVDLGTDVCEFLENAVDDGKSNPHIWKMRAEIGTNIKQKVMFLTNFVVLLPAALGVLVYVRGYTDEPETLALSMMTASFILSSLLILANINYSKNHERRFIRFSDATVEFFESVGIAMEGYDKVIGGRNVKLLTFMSIATLGLFLIPWMCISMRDFNRHIDQQWNFENNLTEALGLMVQKVRGAGAEAD